jgi:hypothetical protein
MIHAKRVFRANDTAKPNLAAIKQALDEYETTVRAAEQFAGGGGWMVEGSPPRLLRDYNQLIESYNRGANI